MREKKQIIKYIALGYTNKEIAEKFSYSLPTIKWAVVDLLKMYKAKNRNELIANYLKTEKNINIEELFDK